jgi:hypothetical protein
VDDLPNKLIFIQKKKEFFIFDFFKSIIWNIWSPLQLFKIWKTLQIWLKLEGNKCSLKRERERENKKRRRGLLRLVRNKKGQVGAI